MTDGGNVQPKSSVFQTAVVDDKRGGLSGLFGGGKAHGRVTEPRPLGARELGDKKMPMSRMGLTRHGVLYRQENVRTAESLVGSRKPGGDVDGVEVEVVGHDA
jgi:hypothetical protein